MLHILINIWLQRFFINHQLPNTSLIALFKGVPITVTIGGVLQFTILVGATCTF